MNIFPKYTKWKDLAITESLGNYKLIQTRVNLNNGKRYLRIQNIFINDSRKSLEAIKQKLNIK